MSIIVKQDPLVTAQIVDFIARERAKALSNREWKHRLAGYGYGIRETVTGQIIETLPHHIEVCPVPAELCA